MTLSTALGLIFIPVTFAVVEYLSHRFVRGGKGTTMDCKPTVKRPPGAETKPVEAQVQSEGGHA